MFSVIVNGRVIGSRGAADLVGEMSAIELTQPRSATITASEPSVVLRLTEPLFSAIADRFPQLWRSTAKVMAHRLRARNKFIGTLRTQMRIFVMSSTEALAVASTVQLGFDHDKSRLVVVWENGVFQASHYPLHDLEEQVDISDFGIVVASPDDIQQSRGNERAVPRDNVIFELGFFMGRLGIERTILLEPAGEDVKLPTDLTGLTTLHYQWAPGRDQAAVFGPTITRLREIFTDRGMRD